MSFTKPPIITIPFANAGDKTLPASGTPTSVVSESLGFPASMSIPAGQPGSVDVPRDQTNGAFNLYSDIIRWINTGGTFTFEADVATAGGYNAGAVLWNAATNSFVRSVKNNNTDDFVTTPGFIDGVSWGHVFGGSGSVIQMVSFTNSTTETPAQIAFPGTQTTTPIPITSGNPLGQIIFTPKSATSRIIITGQVFLGVGISTQAGVAIFKNGSTNAIDYSGSVGNGMLTMEIFHIEQISSLSAITFDFRYGSNTGTPTLNGHQNIASFGGLLSSTIVIREYS